MLPYTKFDVFRCCVGSQNHQDVLIRSHQKSTCHVESGALQPLLTCLSDQLEILSDAAGLDAPDIQISNQCKLVELAKVQSAVLAVRKVFRRECTDV